jgi:dihydrofolate synthase/folylpolyglutamate synthase
MQETKAGGIDSRIAHPNEVDGSTASLQARQQTPQTALDWLTYIEALHPKSIAMGLERVKAVANKLNLQPQFPIITVAGTNGKGSTCAMLSQIYLQSNYRVGTYSSPHISRYNERIRVNNQEISDADLCTSFAAVEAARGDIALTYFEMGTLAAVWHFCQSQLDVVVLEVGLGGRLDAVNIFEPVCSIVTTVDLDHMEFLGDTREKIGFEKAGVFRPHTLAICGDDSPPSSLKAHARSIEARLACVGHDFYHENTPEGWRYQEGEQVLTMPHLGLVGEFQQSNAACVLYAVHQLNAILPTSKANIDAALRAVKLDGRFQTISTEPLIIVDVAHNPHAARALAQNLAQTPCKGATFGVFGMLADKDIAGVVQALTPQIDHWYLADIDHARGAKASLLHEILAHKVESGLLHDFHHVHDALAAAFKQATKNDRIIVFGSFHTVADVMPVAKAVATANRSPII